MQLEMPALGSSGLDGNRFPMDAQRTRFVVQYLMQQRLSIAALEGRMLRQQFVERSTQRTNVRAMIERCTLSARLFGTHVAQRAE